MKINLWAGSTPVLPISFHNVAAASGPIQLGLRTGSTPVDWQKLAK